MYIVILQVVFAFFMLNFLWIVVVFQFHLLQSSLNQDLFDKNGGAELRNCSRMAENGLFIPVPRTDGTCVGIGRFWPACLLSTSSPFIANI